MKGIRIFTHRTLLIVLAGAIFSFAYAIHAQITVPGTRTFELGTLTANWPWRPRFLTAWIAIKLFGPDFINTITFRISWAFCFWIACSSLLAAFSRRIQVSSGAAQFVYVAFILIMFAHYVAPNAYAPWYIYDMPAILFYLIVFLLLTSDTKHKIVLGGILTLVFSTNREPIAVALFHAGAWWFARYWERVSVANDNRRSSGSLLRYFERAPEGNDRRLFAMACIMLAFIGTLVLRQILVYLLDGTVYSSATSMLYEGNEWRVVANLRRIVTEAGNFQQFLATGFGLVVFLPCIFRKLNLSARAMVIASILPLFPLLFVGNFFTELRIYGEYVPLMACLLSMVLALASADEVRQDRALQS